MTGSRARRRPSRRRRKAAAFARALLWVVGLAALAVAAVGAGVIWWSGATLDRDATQLAHVGLQPLAGSLVSTKVVDADGSAVPVTVSHGRIFPKSLLRPGSLVKVEVVVRRPKWLGWAIGRTRRERLTLRTPVAHITSRWLTLSGDAVLRVRYDQPVDRVEAGSHPVDAGGRRVVPLGARHGAGTVEVAAAARSWEQLGAPDAVSWFPKTPHPAVLVSPATGTVLSPVAPIRLTFAQPVSAALGDTLPRFSPAVRGRWRRVDAHTLVFVPGGIGFPFESKPQMRLPRTVTVIAGHTQTQARVIDWSVPSGSVLRLHELLADQGYLPVDWRPDGDAVPLQLRAQLAAAVDPPAGSFSWRFDPTPTQLTRQWTPDQVSQITRGAVMMFQDEHHLTVDSFAGPQVWRALIADEIAGKRRTDGYSYVYVHTHLPQLLTLWHNGSVVLTSPGNTGIAATPTLPGTFPVFEHIPVGTMSGTNPDGSHYNDPGIRWISYFHGGEALHAFSRSSFGTPQSLGCVELPLDSAAKVWPYTPIGTLVTIEN